VPGVPYQVLVFLGGAVDNIAKVSFVVVDMRSHAKVASLMLKFLTDEKINIQMITKSDTKISDLIELDTRDLR
jgi:aspartokinase